MNKILKLGLSIGLCEGAGLAGSIFTFSSVSSWYPTLVKPFFNPPPWIFGPVWTTLYFLMGLSLFLIWGKKNTDYKWFWIQLVLNFAWSIVFFGLRSPALALAVIILLLVSIILMLNSFKKVSQTASWLNFPYLVWVGFASLLNLSIVILNRV